ncbi:hypothetical protein MSG28_015613 [Choristoneura fumiferana]|uniref:Uncharacterized protein n=1 Tax=Choristoneura fumiferana TaxID=7141 RepID=A0ACC0KBF7_CHOFU|nr:hypothetical protein MSG28_015613 [Choristoneura fumiferana]
MRTSIHVPLLGTGLLSEQEGLGHSSHAGPVRIGNFARTIESLLQACAGFLTMFSFTAKLVLLPLVHKGNLTISDLKKTLNDVGTNIDALNNAQNGQIVINDISKLSNTIRGAKKLLSSDSNVRIGPVNSAFVSTVICERNNGESHLPTNASKMVLGLPRWRASNGAQRLLMMAWKSVP